MVPFAYSYYCSKLTTYAQGAGHFRRMYPLRQGTGVLDGRNHCQIQIAIPARKRWLVMSWNIIHQTRWPAEWIEQQASIIGDQRIQTHGFQLWSTLTIELHIDMCRFLVRHLASLGWGKDCLAQFQDTARSWDACCLIYQLSSAIKLPWVQTLSCHYSSWYDTWCC